MSTDSPLVMETVLGMIRLVDQGVYTDDQARAIMNKTEVVAYALILAENFIIENDSILVKSDDELFRHAILTSYGPESRSIMATLAAYYGKIELVQKIRDFQFPELPINGADLIELGFLPAARIGEVLAALKNTHTLNCFYGTDVTSPEYKTALLHLAAAHLRSGS